MSVKPKFPVSDNASNKRVTLKDIAEALGVARSTVSNAYNRPDQLSEALREKVFDTAARLGYVGPDPAARNLRRGVTQTIGLVYPSPLSYAFTDPVAALFIQGLAGEVEREGYTLLLIGGPVPGASDTNLPITTANVDGLIVESFSDDDPAFAAVLARRLPSVLVDSSSVPDLPFVTVTDEEGAHAAAQHLCALGHRRLGVISLELSSKARRGVASKAQQAKAGFYTVRVRLKGYRSAVEAAGLSWKDSVTVVETLDNSLEEGRIAAATLLDTDPQITAVLAMSDRLALGALAVAETRGLSVPTDLSVVGFDDIPSAALSRPALTTVQQPHVDKGRQAGKALLAQLAGEQPVSATLATRLIVRESSSAPRATEK